MKKWIKIVSLFCMVAVFVAGCYKHSYTTGSGGNTKTTAAYSKWHSHWFLGIIGETDVNLDEICPSGNVTIKDKVSFVNGLIGSLIGIVWYPSTVEIYCEDGGEASLTLNPDQMSKIGTNPATLEAVYAFSPEKAAQLSNAVDDHNQTATSSESTTQF